MGIERDGPSGLMECCSFCSKGPTPGADPYGFRWKPLPTSRRFFWVVGQLSVATSYFPLFLCSASRGTDNSFPQPVALETELQDLEESFSNVHLLCSQHPQRTCGPFVAHRLKTAVLADSCFASGSAGIQSRASGVEQAMHGAHLGRVVLLMHQEVSKVRTSTWNRAWECPGTDAPCLSLAWCFPDQHPRLKGD